MKRSFIFLLALCLCAVAALTACTNGKKDESSAADVSKAPAVSKGEESKNNVSSPVSIPDVSMDMSDMSIIPDMSDMFQDESTTGEYSNGMLQESGVETK